MTTKLGSCDRRRPLRDERGATATEYGLLVSFIALIIVIGVATFGGALNAVYEGFAAVVTGGF